MINLGIMVCLTKVREKVVFNFYAKMDFMLSILLRIIVAWTILLEEVMKNGEI